MEAREYEVSCVCAEWCDSCAAYQAGFFELAAHFPEAGFRWLDTENDAEALGDLEVENFPTILVRRGAETLFCGAQPPSHETLKRLLEKLLRGK